LAQLQKVEDNEPIINVAVKYPPPGWEDVFKDSYEEIKQASEVIEHEQIYVVGSGTDQKTSLISYTPHTRDIFKAFWLTPLDRVRVVIYGQDPYPGYSNGDLTAQGLAFSVRKNDNIPASLRNIFIQVKKNMGDKFEIPTHGDLTHWAEQGVLLLNASLTCFVNSKNSHSGIWKPFLYKVIQAIKTKRPNTIHVMWGKEAQSLSQYLGDSTMLMASHPFPLSASKGRDAFFNCRHFSQINAALSKTPEGPIDWNLP
jgi:uracil-DNA glycosylase